jgi:hypothetical protein
LIAQVLNREFVLDRLREVRDHLEDTADDRRRAGGEGPEIDPGEAAEALAAADRALEEEARASSGQPGFEPEEDDRRGEEPAPIDDFSFFSRDPAISNLQSALEQYYREKQLVDEAEPDTGRRSYEDDPAVTDLSLPGVEPPRDPDGRRVFDKFSITDIRWVSSLFAMGVRHFRDRHPFPQEPAEPLRIGRQARVVIVGDWGSGIPRARKVAEEIRKVLDEGNGREQHVVHLGDVYYSGWEYEYRDRFLKYWPVRPEEKDRIRSWNLNGNHDMYAGGQAFFGHALKDERFARQQGSSWFSLVNDDWTILGLDTAWEEHGLEGGQADWARGLLQSSPGRGLLLSHHQPWSAYEKKGGAKLRQKIKPVLDTGRVHAWFWGHEHRCVAYGLFGDLQYGRCVGHGGVPVYLSRQQENPDPPIAWEFRESFRKGLETWALFGFTVLDFDGPVIAARYLDENGQEVWSERIG